MDYTPTLGPMDQRRFAFIKHLCTLSERGRAHLLGVEDDKEIAELKRVAIEQQWFEVAASINTESKRRDTERRINKTAGKFDCPHCRGRGVVVYTAGDSTREDECGCVQK